MLHLLLQIQRLSLLLVVVIFLNASHAQSQSTTDTPYDNSMGMDQESYLEWVGSTGKLLQSYYKSYNVVRDSLTTLYGEYAVSPVYGVEHTTTGFVFGFGAHSGPNSFLMNYRVTVSNSGSIQQIEVFEDSLKAIGELSFTANAIRTTMRFFEQNLMPKPIDDTNYRRAVIPHDEYQYLAIYSPQQNDDESLIFGSEYVFWVEKISSQLIGYKPWHKRSTRITKRVFPGRLPLVMNKELAYLTPVDVALARELDQDMPFLMAYGAFFVFRDGRIERLPDDDPMANPTIRSRN